MSARIDAAERLKAEWTDRRVVVVAGDDRLERFHGRIGTVRTVNMNGKAIVEFGGTADVAWYDLPPDALREATAAEITAAEKPKKKTAAADRPHKRDAKPAAESAPKAQKLSPLEIARAQDAAAGSSSDAASGAEQKPAAPATKLSPLEMARAQDAAAGSTGAGASASERKTAAPAKKLSPLEMARLQDAGGAKSSGPAVEPTPTAEPAADGDPSDLPPAGPERTAAIIRLARAEGGPA